MTDHEKTRAQLVEELAELRKQADNAALSEWVLSVVIPAMTAFLETGSWQKATAILLSGALQQTNSEYGFAGVVVEEQGRQVLRILFFQGIVWDKQKEIALYDGALHTYQEIGYFTFTNFDNLFGRTITGKAAIIANDPHNDPRSGGIPEGHPPLKHFLGVPVLRKGTVIGMIGIANRPGGYTRAEQGQIELLVQAAGVLYDSYRRQENETMNEKALKLFRVLIDQSNDAIEVIDSETGRFLDVNEKGCLDIGYSREEFLSLSVFDIDPFVDQASFKKNMAELQKSGTLLWEGIHRRKDGSTFPVEVNIKYVQLDRDYLITVVRDITERKKAEDMLKAHEAELKQQVKHQDAMIKIGQAIQEMTRPSGLEQVVAVCYEQLTELGFDFQSLMIHRLLDEENKIFESFEVHPGGAVGKQVITGPNIYQMWSAAGLTYRPDLTVDMGGLTPERLKEISVRCGKRIRCILDVAHPCGTLALHSARPDAFSASEIQFIEQITWMISLGILRVQDMEHLDALVRHFPDGVCLLDGRHRLIFTNPVAEGYARIFEMIPGQVVSKIGDMPLMDLLVPRQDGLPHEIRLEEPVPRIFEMNAQPIHREAANGGWVVIFRDVTREREIQERIQQQDRLASVGQLAAGIAHDFNNVLTVMTGTAQIIQFHSDIPEQLKDDLNTIYTQGQRAAQLIRQVMDFSRKTVIDRHPLDLIPFQARIGKDAQPILA